MYERMSGSGANTEDPEIDRINLPISRSFLDVVDEAWRERGFNSRSEFIRYALRGRSITLRERASGRASRAARLNTRWATGSRAIGGRSSMGSERSAGRGIGCCLRELSIGSSRSIRGFGVESVRD
jgi:Arc/MetJ-type ribon-helix-helix transcriptional regulator